MLAKSPTGLSQRYKIREAFNAPRLSGEKMFYAVQFNIQKNMLDRNVRMAIEKCLIKPTGSASINIL